MKKRGAFTLVELMVVIAIIGVISTLLFVVFTNVRAKARDVKRKHDLTVIGRFITATTCYVPDGGFGEYDLADLFSELKSKYPQVAQLGNLPADPKSGDQTETNYRYQITAANKCIIYANLENEAEPVTLGGLTAPTAGRGTGIVQAASEGVNGTNIFYQIGQ